MWAVFTVESQDTRSLQSRFWFDPIFRAFNALGQSSHAVTMRLKRRTDWFTHNLTVPKAMNVMSAVAAYGTKRGEIRSWPVFLIVDISPLCNLNCTVCLHARPDGNPDLLKQRFQPSQRISLDQYSRLVDEVQARTLSMVLYYLGDPIVHPDLAEICRITHAAHMNMHVSTNLSRAMSDEELYQLTTSGLTHLTVCVDGLTQDTYARTRVGGRLDRVIANLRRICEIRRTRRQRFPRVEVQYIKYPHNLHQVQDAHRFFRSLGADQVHELWGWLHNYTDRDPGKFHAFGPRPAGVLPSCHWPYLFSVVKYDGTVLPCCAYRLGEQYTDEDDPRHLGNALESSVWDVWTSPEYRTVRRFVSDPTLAEREPELTSNFCDACPRLFNTDYVERTCRYANEHAFEELYTMGADGRPHRRPETIPECVSACEPVRVG